MNFENITATFHDKPRHGETVRCNHPPASYSFPDKRGVAMDDGKCERCGEPLLTKKRLTTRRRLNQQGQLQQERIGAGKCWSCELGKVPWVIPQMDRIRYSSKFHFDRYGSRFDDAVKLIEEHGL